MASGAPSSHAPAPAPAPTSPPAPTTNGHPSRSIPSTTLPPPSNEASGPTHSIKRGAFTISTLKRPILKAAPIEALGARIGIAVPEMIFGDNFARIAHAPSGWSLEFNAGDALDLVDKTGARRLQVVHAEEWNESRIGGQLEGIREVVKPFDWTYSTDYRGSESAGSQQLAQGDAQAEDTVQLRPDPAARIPRELLTRPDPILLFDELVLFEDELADNGIALLSVKLRVMPERMLLLSRFFLRVDGVLFRLRDTRVFVEFGDGRVVREYTAMEDSYQAVERACVGQGRAADTAVFRDPDAMARVLTVRERIVESAVLG